MSEQEGVWTGRQAENEGVGWRQNLCLCCHCRSATCSRLLSWILDGAVECHHGTSSCSRVLVLVLEDQLRPDFLP